MPESQSQGQTQTMCSASAEPTVAVAAAAAAGSMSAAMSAQHSIVKQKFTVMGRHTRKFSNSTTKQSLQSSSSSQTLLEVDKRNWIIKSDKSNKTLV